MAHAIRYRLLTCLIALVTVFGVVFTAAPSIAFAAGTELSFDGTSVTDDLTSSSAGGKTFDLKDYPYDESKQAQVINFVEYCYSYKANMRNNYGLYVYIYNPQGLNISTTSKSNNIQMATRYDEEGNPSDYAKFDLRFLSKSEESNYKNLFYKFKVVDKAIDGKTFAQRVNSNERRYDLRRKQRNGLFRKRHVHIHRLCGGVWTGRKCEKHAYKQGRISRNGVAGRKAYLLPHKDFG